MNRAIAILSNLHIRFPGDEKDVVGGVSLTISAGECLAIVGESGSGKTLTALALLGLVPPGAVVTADVLTIGDTEAHFAKDRDWRSIRGRLAGLVSQDALVSLDPLRRIGREVAEVLELQRPKLARAEVSQRVRDALTRASVPNPEIRERQYPHELSGGLRQRALIASAIAGEPGLLIADEPTTALDSISQAKIMDLLAELKASGLALLLISHDLHLVRKLADRIAVMRHGVIIEMAPSAELLENPSHPYTQMLLGSKAGSRRAPLTKAPQETPVAMALTATRLFRTYPGPGGTRVRALEGVSLAVASGTTLGIVGESGSGKSTLARLLMGLESPDAGTVELLGLPWSSEPERRRRSRRSVIQLVEQNPYDAFDPRWSVRRILAEAVALDDSQPRFVAVRGSSSAESSAQRGAKRVNELMDQVGLPRNLLSRRPHQLSGGQRQRVAIARALARHPSVLICDEPVSALDAHVQSHILALLSDLQQSLGLTIVIISHDLGVIAQMSDDIVVLHNGRVIEHGPAEQILHRPVQEFTRALIEASLSL
jgi:peptide/nickel transport system ATP-binding protein